MHEIHEGFQFALGNVSVDTYGGDGTWRSLVARTLGVGEVPSSNLGVPTKNRRQAAGAGIERDSKRALNRRRLKALTLTCSCHLLLRPAPAPAPSPSGSSVSTPATPKVLAVQTPPASMPSDLPLYLHVQVVLQYRKLRHRRHRSKRFSVSHPPAAHWKASS